MPKTPQSNSFLDAATAGLRNDRELRLDVSAELQAHLDDHALDALSRGLSDDEANEQAIRAMGSAAELADSLQQANRRRMRLRAVVRWMAQWLLVPLSVAVAFQSLRRVLPVISLLPGDLMGGTMQSPAPLPKRLTPDQKLILQGDPARPTPLDRQKAIWDRWPDSKTYLHHYVTCLLTDNGSLGATPEACQAAVDSELARLQPLDPDNARFDYLMASRLLDRAIDIQTTQQKNDDGTKQTRSSFTVKDRAALDLAMEHFRTGLTKPTYRTYTSEFNVEKLAILGPPQSLAQQVGIISVLAGTLLPDITSNLKLARASLFYGELLAGEGRKAEGEMFLNSYRIFLPHLNFNSFTLIESLVIGAIAGIAADGVPSAYERLGDSGAAARAKAETDLLAAPVRRFREANQKAKDDWSQILGTRAGNLAGMLLPALGDEKVSEQELAPSRHLEYVVAERGGLALLSLVMALLLVFFLGAAAYYRWVRPGRTASFLLLPDIVDVLHLLGLGVVAPLLGYALMSRVLPWAPREVGLTHGAISFSVQLLALLWLVLEVTVWQARRLVARRCRELLLPVAPPAHRAWRGVFGGLTGLLLVVSLLPAEWWDLGETSLVPLSWGLPILLVLVALAYAIHRDVRHGRDCAAYYGCLARTLVPVLALAMILLNWTSGPYLRWSERRLLAEDTLLRIDPLGGFTTVEARVTARLREEIRQACANVQAMGESAGSLREGLP